MPFNLDTALAGISERYTAEQRKHDEDARAYRLIALKPRLDPNSYEQRVARARQQILGVLEQIEMLQAAPDSELKNARLTQATKRFAELVAETGDPESAAALSPDSEHSAWYDSLLEAIDKDDGDSCDCTNNRLIDRSGRTPEEFVAPARIFIGEIPSAKHGRLMKVEQCSKCFDLNAR